ncbi:MAG: four helix bundle protein, partial [Lentisphaerae bacterium]|nr:four helix bundle protein [Lentisphaerota bacterium]
RQRGLPKRPPENSALTRFRAMRCATLDEFRAWVAEEVRREKENPKNTDGAKHTDTHERTRTKSARSGDVRGGRCLSVSSSAVSFRDLPAVLAANGALSLLNLCLYLVKRQLEAQVRAFEEQGGFTERLYRWRTDRRNPRND